MRLTVLHVMIKHYVCQQKFLENVQLEYRRDFEHFHARILLCLPFYRSNETFSQFTRMPFTVRPRYYDWRDMCMVVVGVPVISFFLPGKMSKETRLPFRLPHPRVRISRGTQLFPHYSRRVATDADRLKFCGLHSRIFRPRRDYDKSHVVCPFFTLFIQRIKQRNQ